MSKTCPNPEKNRDDVTKSPLVAPIATSPHLGDVPVYARCTTSVTSTADDPSTLSFTTPFIVVRNVASIFPSTCPTLPIRILITQNGSFAVPSVMSLKTDRLTETPVGDSGGIIGSSFPSPPFKTGWRRQGKKIRTKIETDDYLHWAFENFSGYIAVDELYDGPFCILSIVDNREYKRLTYKVLDRDPNADDIRQLFRAFKKILKKRKLEMNGVTTDGSKLYPEPIKELFPGVPHQVCEFHVLKEINKAILKAVTSARRDLKKTKVKRSKRGRPTSGADKALVKRNERIQAKITALFDNRFLFVQKELTTRERETLREITKGFPELRKLREIEDEVYRLFDRRCRTETALGKLRKLRQRVKRFKDLSQVLKKLESPTLEKSLVFLDDQLLPSTSNAVERGNRRHRKMQKTVYRVRVFGHIDHRIALDMFRDAHLPGRHRTLLALHLARNK
jgi:hypothetical protein